MFKQIFDVFTGLLVLVRDVQELRHENETLKSHLAELKIAVTALSKHVEALESRERLEREKLLLQLENVVVRQLPPSGSKRKRKS